MKLSIIFDIKFQKEFRQSCSQSMLLDHSLCSLNLRISKGIFNAVKQKRFYFRLYKTPSDQKEQTRKKLDK